MRMLVLSLAIVASATLYAQPPAPLQRGDLVRVRPAPNVSNVTTPVVRVVAIPGDRIRIDHATVYVNDVPVSGFSSDFLTRVAQAPERTPQVVPAGHYFVMGEQRTNQDISEYWGQHAGLSLERAR
jgi:signal peptidase I